MGRYILSKAAFGVMIILFVGLFSLSAFAGWQDHFEFAAGTMYEYGKLGDSEMGLPSRSMGSESVQIYPAYRINSKWLLGLDFQYRFQQQLSSLTASGGTNLASRGYLFGIGTSHSISDRWTFQATFHFMGSLNFDHTTTQQQTDGLRFPLGLSLKGQYFPFENIPVSIDGAIGYQYWSKFRIEGTNYSKPANQWTVGAGITFHFMKYDPAKSDSMINPKEIEEPTVTSQKLEASDQKEKVPQRVRLEGTAFARNSATLSSEARTRVREFGLVVTKSSFKKLLVKGYTDTLGNPKKNKNLSLRRALSVRAELIEIGIPQSRIEASGYGDENPISDNSTEEGRQKNRRVEITIEN